MGACLFSGCGNPNDNSDGSIPIKGLYTLDEAYQYGWITESDLQSIAYYYHEHRHEEDWDKLLPDDFTPKQKDPETLEEFETQIKTDYLNKVINVPNGSFDQVDLYAYYGAYYDCFAIEITDTYFLYDYLIEPEHKIGNVTFLRYSNAFVRIWKKDLQY